MERAAPRPRITAVAYRPNPAPTLAPFCRFPGPALPQLVAVLAVLADLRLRELDRAALVAERDLPGPRLGRSRDGDHERAYVTRGRPVACVVPGTEVEVPATVCERRRDDAADVLFGVLDRVGHGVRLVVQLIREAVHA